MKQWILGSPTLRWLLLFLFKHTLFKCYVAGETEDEALRVAAVLSER